MVDPARKPEEENPPCPPSDPPPREPPPCICADKDPTSATAHTAKMAHWYRIPRIIALLGGAVCQIFSGPLFILSVLIINSCLRPRASAGTVCNRLAAGCYPRCASR